MARAVDDAAVAELTRGILSSRKYSVLNADFVHETAAREAFKHRSFAEADKAVRARLHQLCASYVDERSLAKAQKLVGEADFASTEAAAEVCSDVLSLHISSRERLTSYRTFYTEVCAVTGVPDALLDIACGLNPFSLPYMPVRPRVVYAVDVHAGCVSLCNALFRKLGMQETAVCGDALTRPLPRADVALVQKLLPLLEHERADAASFLRGIPAEHIVCTYPTASLSGRAKGMKAHYEELCKKQFPGEMNVVYQNEIGRELVYILKREG